MIVIMALVFGLFALSAKEASAATRLGGLDLEGYCKKKYSTSGPMFSAVGTAGLKEHNAGGWRCFVMTTSLYPKATWPPSCCDIVRKTHEYSINTNDVCQRQYGGGAWAETHNWNDPYSWSCYR